MNFSRQNGLEASFFRLKHSRGAGNFGLLNPSDFGNRPFAGQVTLEDRQVSLAVYGLVPRPNHILIGRWGIRHIFEHFRHRLSADGKRVTVEQALIQQHFHHLRDAAHPVQIHCNVATAGFEVAKHGDAGADRLKVIQGQRHINGTGNGK